MIKNMSGEMICRFPSLIFYLLVRKNLFFLSWFPKLLGVLPKMIHTDSVNVVKIIWPDVPAVWGVPNVNFASPILKSGDIKHIY